MQPSNCSWITLLVQVLRGTAIYWMGIRGEKGVACRQGAVHMRTKNKSMQTDWMDGEGQHCWREKAHRLPAPLALAGSKREIRGEGRVQRRQKLGRGGWRAKQMQRPCQCRTRQQVGLGREKSAAGFGASGEEGLRGEGGA